MRQLEVVLFVLVFGLVVSCGRPPEDHPTVASTPLGESVVSDQKRMTLPVQIPEGITPLASTVAPSPLQTPEPILPTPLPPSFYLRDGTPIPAVPLVACIPQAEFIGCYDELLDMSFFYPSFIGAIHETKLRRGGYAGYSYEYFFEQIRRSAAAGGRSRDFSEGRDIMYTDQQGFGTRTVEEICESWQADICREIRPGILITVSFPKARWFCGVGGTFSVAPYILVMLDLPRHPLIQGFGFSLSLMTYEAEEELGNITGSETFCSPEAQMNFDKQMDQMRLNLETGAAEPEIQMRYDGMVQLAKSIQSSFLGDGPDAQPASP